MRILNNLALAIGLLLALSWVLRFNDYFFKSTIQDDLALGFTLVLSVVLFWIFRAKKKFHFLVLLGTLLPWLLFAGISELVQWTNWGSLALHVFLILTTFCCINSRISRWMPAIALSLIVIHVYPSDMDLVQKEYYDRVEESRQTRQGMAEIVNWKNDKWHYYNGQLQFSTVDAHMWREAYIQPVMQVVPTGARVLLIGGESEQVEAELRKFDAEIAVAPYDSEFSDSLDSDGHPFEISDQLIEQKSAYDLIILDLPDPINVEFAQFYSSDFFRLCSSALKSSGKLVSHSSDLYSKNSRRNWILENAETAGFNMTPYHAQIPTIGQWTWFIGTKDSTDVKEQLGEVEMKTETIWWNQEAMDMMLSFGKEGVINQ